MDVASIIATVHTLTQPMQSLDARMLTIYYIQLLH